MDAGDAVWKSAHIPAAAVPQQRVKADLILHALSLGGIDAMTPGEGDLALGVPEYRAWVQQYSLPVVLANLSCADGAPFEPARRVERGGLTLGFVGVLDPSHAPAGCTATPPATAVSAALSALGPVDVVVVLSHMDRDADSALAEAVPEIDLVVNGHARLTHQAPAALPGAALQLGSGSRGRSVGVASVQLIPGARGFQAGDAVDEAREKLERTEARLKSVEERLAKASGPQVERLERQKELYETEKERVEEQLALAKAERKEPAHTLSNELITLDERVADEPGVAALLEKAKAAVTALEAGLPLGAADDGPRAFVGASTCQGCHPGPYTQWSQTPHASAWATLEAENRALDRDCYGCHATGVGQPGGPSSPGAVGELKGVQCESCHGPGLEHVRAAGKGPMKGGGETTTCVECHDGVKDEGRFDAAVYLPKVVHADHGGAAKPD